MPYESRLFPQHLYEFRFDDWDLVVHQGIVRCAPDPVAPPSNCASDIRAAFRPWYHVERDIRAGLGSPASVPQARSPARRASEEPPAMRGSGSKVADGQSVGARLRLSASWRRG